MIWKILGGVVLALALFLTFVATREGHFRYERSGLIQASPEKIFPYLSQFQLGSKWSPYEQVDPQMKREFQGADGQVGSIMKFEGNSDVGAGQLEFLKIVPSELVEIRLTMTKPFFAENLIEYRLTPEAGGTRFSWAMSGDGGFLGKLISVLIDCEKMVGGQMATGVENLKKVVEAQP